MKTVHLSFEQALELQLLVCSEITKVNNGIRVYRKDVDDVTLSLDLQQLSGELLDSHVERRDKLQGILDLVAVSPYRPTEEKE